MKVEDIGPEHVGQIVELEPLWTVPTKLRRMPTVKVEALFKVGDSKLILHSPAEYPEFIPVRWYSKAERMLKQFLKDHKEVK